MDKNINRQRNRRQATDMVIFHAVSQAELAVITAVEAAFRETKSIGKEIAWRGRKMGAMNFVRGDSRWSENYLALHSIYPERLFRRRFGVPKVLSWKVHGDLAENIRITGG